MWLGDDPDFKRRKLLEMKKLCEVEMDKIQRELVRFEDELSKLVSIHALV